MRLNAATDLRTTAWAKHHPRRIHVRVGPWNFTATEAEAVALASDLVAAIEELRADPPTNARPPRRRTDDE
jgi:hypothetical protein